MIEVVGVMLWDIVLIVVVMVEGDYLVVVG